MKKLNIFIFLFICLILSGCSWDEVNKGIDDTETLITIRTWLDEKIPSVVIDDIELPTAYPTISSKITWESSNENIISKTGKFTSPSTNTNVILTAVITLTNSTDTKNSYKTYTKTVNAMYVDEVFDNQRFETIKNWLVNQIPASTTQNINLPSSHTNIASNITWRSSNVNVIDHDGKVTISQTTRVVELTATIKLDNTRQTEFKITVTVNSVNNTDDQNKAQSIKEYLDNNIPNIVNSDIILPLSHPTINSTISWKSSDENYLSSSGIYGNVTSDKTVYITATVTLDNQYTFTYNKSVSVVVNDENINIENMNKVKAWLNTQILKSTSNDLILPTQYLVTPATISWVSSNINIMTNEGQIRNKVLKTTVTLTATITLSNNYKETHEIIVEILPSSDEESENQLNIVEEYIRAVIPNYIGTDIELPQTFSLLEGSVIRYEILPKNILSTTGKFTYPSQETELTIMTIITLANGRNRSLIEYSKALPESGVTKAIQTIIDEIQFHFSDNKFSADIPESYLLSSYNDASISWTSNLNTVIDGSGKLLRPTYDKNVTLTAKISIPGLNDYYHKIEVTALGIVPIPEPANIERYFKDLIGTEIKEDIFLPGKYNEANLKGISDKVSNEDIMVLWSVTSGNTNVLVNNNQIVRQTEDVVNLTLTAKLVFNNQEIGVINLYNITVKAIKLEEMVNHSNMYIKSSLVMNVTTDTLLPTKNDKYGILINWTTSNQDIATISNGIVNVNPIATNLSSVFLIATLTRNGQVLGEPLTYKVNVMSSSKVLTYPENIKDEILYNYLVSKFATNGKLTTDSFLSSSYTEDKWFTLDLSYDTLKYNITDLTGIGYITTLRSLNISGQNQIKDFTALSSLKNLEVLKAKDCNLNSLTVNEYSLLSNLPNLRALDLSNNNLSSISSITDLNESSLEVLYLANNNISDITSLSNFNNIKTLILSNNQIKDITPLSALTNIDFLYLDHNCLENINPIENLKRIHTLRLDNQETIKFDNTSSLSNIEVLSNLKQLRNLYIQNNIIEDIGYLDTLGNLSVFNASNNNIANMFAVQSFSNLITLNLENNKIKGSTAYISSLTRLESLRLEGNSFSGGTYFESTVKSLKNLKELSISSTNEAFIITDLSFLKDMPNLTYLSIPYCNVQSTVTKTTEEGTIIKNNFDYIANITELTYLDISGNYFSDISSINKLEKIEHLFINDLKIDDFEDENGLFFITRFMYLKTLSLVNCNLNSLQFNEEAWIHQLTKLEYLNLSYNQFSQIDISDIYTSSNARTLKSLYLDSKSSYQVIKSNYLERLSSLEKLSVINANLGNMPIFNQKLKYINISYNGTYDLTYLENNNELLILKLNGVITNFTPLNKLNNLQEIYISLNTNENMNLVNLETLKSINDKGVSIYINNEELFTPNAKVDGNKVFVDIINDQKKKLKIDLEREVCDANEQFLMSNYNGFNLVWEVSLNQTDYNIINNVSDLCTLLDGKPSSGKLYWKIKTSLYSETIELTYELDYELSKVILINYYDRSEVIKLEKIDYEKTAPNLSLPKVGYTFEGWFTSNDYKELYNFNKILTENEVIYGKYTPNTYKVTFKVDGSVLTTRSYVFDSPYDITDLKPTKGYYNFVGWTISNEDMYYQKQEEAINTIVPFTDEKFKAEADIVLSPVWSQNDENYNYIKRPSDFVNMNINEKYKLIDDITLPTNWKPFNEFKGTLDGNGFTITIPSQLKFEIGDSKDTVHGSLFNYNYGTIRNMIIAINEITTWSTSTKEDNYHKGTYTVYNGGVVGINQEGGVIDNVTVSSSKTMNNDRNNSIFGGIIGQNNGTISNSKVTSTIYSTGDTGGIAGRNTGSIYKCNFTGTIGIYIANDNGGQTLRSWGGIVGYSIKGNIEECNSVKVTFNYYGENDIYHRITLWWHDTCNLRIKVGVIIGDKASESKMINCSMLSGSNKLNFKGGDFHNGTHEKKYLFAYEGGKIGKIS